ncbi:MAG: hypothetical protein GDA54_05880, partial [Alphaproteobacteria bacterium GM7ARS4]|nr:hypothetical protein [Alphaproteobacteria bacterium GM7ARS4]
YPHIHNYNREKNKLGEDNIGSTLDLREVFFSVTSSEYGSVLAGKTLSLFLGKNILTDMTLFGVGAVGGVGTSNALSGSTSLGRIGYGYVYPNFNAALRYTSPDVQGFKLTAGVYDPSRIANAAAGESATYRDTPLPRWEAELTHQLALPRFNVTLDSWGSAMYQTAEQSDGDDVSSWGLGGGTQVAYKGLTITGSGYWGKGLGSVLMLDVDALDPLGNERRHYGFIAQATYDFGNDTHLGVSWGTNYTSATTAELTTGTPGAIHRFNRLFDVMVWHNVNANLRVGVEYGNQRTRNRRGDDSDVNVFSAGGFFFF